MADENTQDPEDKQKADEAAAAEDNKVTLKEEDAADNTTDDTSDNEDTVEEPVTDTEYPAYDHPALREVTDILKEAKLTPTDANAFFAEAVATGDLSKIDRKGLIDKLGQKKAELVLVLAESYYTTQYTQFQKVVTDIQTMCGGEEAYNAMREWATAKRETDPAFAKELVEINEMLDSGKPKVIKAAAKELYELFKADPNASVTANLHEGTHAPNSSGLEPLSRQQYTDAIEKAHRDGNYEKVHKQLWARRQAGIKLGN